MTLKEFSLEFDILYNNISSNTAPGIDDYEKSIYLTQAQLQIVKEYNDIANKYTKGFDQSEKRRVDLKELIRDYKTTSKVQNDDNIDTEFNSYFFKIPQDVFLIKFERCFYTDPCATTESEDLIKINVVPITLDEYNEKIDNPFRKPYEKEAWRIDYSQVTFPAGIIDSESSVEKVIEIISSQELEKYHMRYLKYPNPIILTSLVDYYGNGETLTIDGLSTTSNCDLNPEIHREILDRAVELAIRDYKDGSLQSKVELDKRNN